MIAVSRCMAEEILTAHSRRNAHEWLRRILLYNVIQKTKTNCTRECLMGRMSAALSQISCTKVTNKPPACDY
jgi:hypothetical protein